MLIYRDKEAWICSLRWAYEEYTLEELYGSLQKVTKDLEAHRRNEPSTKRKYQKQHKFWVDRTQDYLDEMHVIQDEIDTRNDEKPNVKKGEDRI